MNQVDYALEYLKRGYSIIPCRADKKPLFAVIDTWEEFQTRRPTEAEVLAWWGKHPEANIGIICGPISGLTVVDCDSPAAWEALDEYLPDSLMAPVSLTPTGNHQIFFKHKPGLHSQNRVMDETDIKTDGGYVIAPPSMCEYDKNGKHIMGGHSWKVNGIEPPEMPPELADELEKRQIYLSTTTGKGGAKKPEGWRDELFIGVPEGQRNDTAAKLAGDYIRRGLSDPEVLALLTEWNTRNLPPLDERELQTVVASIRKTDSRKTPPAEPEQPTVAAEKAENILRPAVLESENFISKEMPQKTVFLDPWLSALSIVLITGARGIGKSWFLLALLLAITKFKSFGPWAPVTSVPGLYLDGEMAATDAQERLVALDQDGVKQSPLFIYSDAYASSQGLPRANLLNPEWRKDMKSLLLDLGVKVWAVDNIASLTPGIDENSKQEWDPINQWLLELRFNEITTLLAHHTNRTGGQRGTSGREDNIDISILLKQPEGYTAEDGASFIASFTKARIAIPHLSKIADTAFKMQLDPNGKTVWTWGALRQRLKEQIIALYQEGIPKKDIAAELKCTFQNVSQTIRRHEKVEKTV
jgi:hypothetical protein